MKTAVKKNITSKPADIIRKYTDNVIIRMSDFYPDAVGGQEYCMVTKAVYAELLRFKAVEEGEDPAAVSPEKTPTVIISIRDFYNVKARKDEYREISRGKFNELMARKKEKELAASANAIKVKASVFAPYIDSDMKDETTKAQISKRDITTDEELPGAKLVILDENSNVVEEWVSTDIPHIIEGKLIAGKEYTLREITAPEGYEIAQDIKFTVNEDGSITEVVMYDESTPDIPDIPDIPDVPDIPEISDTPSTPGTPEKPGKPSTPSTPSKPSTPTAPEKPSAPEQPTTPERTTAKVTTANPRTGTDAGNIAFVGMIIACVVMVISAANKKKYDEE